MRSVNKVIIIGNLTRDPEMRQTPNGQNVTTFGIATNREWTTREGDRKSSAEFHECVAWARLAEICEKYLKKGQLVYVEGYLKTRSWDSAEGVRKFKTEIVVKDMIRLEKRNGSDQEEDYTPDQDDYYDDEDQVTESSENTKDYSSEPTETASEEPTTATNTETPSTPVEEPSVQPEPSSHSEEDPITKDLGL